jgi:hypothetical protein
MPKSIQSTNPAILPLMQQRRYRKRNPTFCKPTTPPLTGTQWETQYITSLNWNQGAVQPLLDYVELKHSKSFLILLMVKLY